MTQVDNILTPEKLTIDTQLCFALHSASSTIEHLYRPLLANYDLTYPQYIVLMALAEQDDISITALATRLNVSKATMTPLLRRLEAKKLIRRNVNKANERQKSLKITDAGRGLFERASGVTQQVFLETGLTQENADDLIRLSKLIAKP